MADIGPRDRTARRRLVRIADQQVRARTSRRCARSTTGSGSRRTGTILATCRRLASSIWWSRAPGPAPSRLAAIGPPSILVPLPGSIDQDRLAAPLQADATRIRSSRAGPAPDRLASEMSALSAEPRRLAAITAARRSSAARVPPSGLPSGDERSPKNMTFGAVTKPVSMRRRRGIQYSTSRLR